MHGVHKNINKKHIWHKLLNEEIWKKKVKTKTFGKYISTISINLFYAQIKDFELYSCSWKKDSSIATGK